VCLPSWGPKKIKNLEKLWSINITLTNHSFYKFS
jgi:hypothetical protein